MPPLRTQQAALINAIGLLLGQPPRALEAELRAARPLPAVPPAVPVGLPGELVRRRPDVREAEARLHAATAETGVAVANFYPDVTLTGVVDVNGLRLRDAFSLPAAGVRHRADGDDSALPGRAADGRAAAAAIAAAGGGDHVPAGGADGPGKRWTTPWSRTPRRSGARRRRAGGGVAEPVTAWRAARQRYAEGAADFLNVVTAEQQLLQAQNNLATDDTQIATDLVALYRALGGGWERGAAERAPATAPDAPGGR